MKQITLTISLTLITCISILGQKLTLTDLTNLCNKKNWEDVNIILLAKGWTYYDSEKGNTFKYNTITWSFKKDYYNDKAQGWFYLYTYEGFPNKISYTVVNKESYSLIQSSISSAGFKLVNSEIEDNEVISTYGNTSYTLVIKTEKRKVDDWESRSLTSYNITLIKKAGIYDADNGKKTEYYYGEVVKAEYTLLNGELNGQLKAYHYNGKLKKTGAYNNGVENGLFKEYDEEGKIVAVYTMKNGQFNGNVKRYHSNGILKESSNYINGKKTGQVTEYGENGEKILEYMLLDGKVNGKFNQYENNKISITLDYIDGVKEGEYAEYYYDEAGKLIAKNIGQYKNNEKNSTWTFYSIETSGERVIKFENYVNGIKNGNFQDIIGDSLVIGKYEYDKMQGKALIYQDFSYLIFGDPMITDTAQMSLIAEGNYLAGVKHGYWKNYDFSGTLRSEGNFVNGKESGEWKFYYTKIIDMPYSQKLYMVQNYSNGKLNGKRLRFSYIIEEKYPCKDSVNIDKNTDTCTNFIYHKVLETSYYKDGELDGPFELLDSLNELIVKGNFIKDKKNGEWFHRYSKTDPNNVTYFSYEKGNYLNDVRDGAWIEYYSDQKTVAKKFNYKNGSLHGIYIVYNRFNNPIETKKFDNGKFKELISYDSAGIKPIAKYEIFEEYDNGFKCKHTIYMEDGHTSQIYWVKKDKEINHEWFEFEFIINEKLGNFKNGSMGFKDGEYALFYKGKPQVIGEYYQEKKSGFWEFFYENQNVKIEINYINYIATKEKYLTMDGEMFSGEFIFYSEDGKTKESRKIKAGFRNGKTTYYDILSKKVIKKEIYKDGLLKL